MATPIVPFSVARVISTVLTATVWWVLLFITTFIFSGAGRAEHVSTLVMTNVALCSLVLVPLFTTQGVLVGMLDGYLQKRFSIPTLQEDPSASPKNPWAFGVTQTLRFGLAAAAIAYVIIGRSAPDTFTSSMFAVRLASFGALVSAICAWHTAGTPFLDEMRVPAAKRRFIGSAENYRWSRHGLPQGLLNAGINAVVAFAIFPLPVSQVGALAKTEIVVGDTVITLFILSVLIATGARTHARVDALWGIRPEPSTPNDFDMAAAVVPAFFAGIAFCVFVFACFALTHAEGLGVYPWAVYRALACGLYSGWLANRVARCDFTVPVDTSAGTPQPL